MHIALQLLLFWSAAFVTLCSALVLLNIFDGVIGNDLVLHSLGKEAAIAGAASLVEGVCVWLLFAFAPGALSRAIVFPALIVALIYKIGHFEDWSKGDVLMLLGFQLVTTFILSTLLTGHFLLAAVCLLGFAAVLAVVASFMKDL